MKIEVITGCTASDILVDGKSIQNFCTSEIDMLINDLLDKVREAAVRNEIQVLDLIQLFQYDEQTVGGSCEQCGDHVEVTTYNL
jgi:hypothetical protein